ncbi:uncharacterized protein OCT59_002808 [Rhizophagus irregularis]|uniref:uncharacterized protein n=1 Tax=Rhizophagus irregularis TaxID=588596 RepID=UPI0033267A19|nr:hypothetical protein OCT59_002808 [Rhizophagus irregularis]
MANVLCQNKIIRVDSINVQDDVNITVQIDDISSKFVLVNLNLKCKLSKIRKRLEQNTKVKMNDTLSFANMFNNNNGSSLAEIAREDEEEIILENIIDKKSKTLYLKSESDWRFFKDKFKLEYGHYVTLEKVNNRAFTMVDCEMNEIVDGYENNTIQIDLEEDKIIKNDFLLIADIDIPNFAKLGVSIENSNIKNSNIITSSTYNIIEYKKMSLKLKLEPTKEFIEAVKGVIDSKDPRKFKDLINDFGQFIPKKVILGGRAYFIAKENSEENSGEYVKNTDCQAPNIKVEKKSLEILNKSNSSKYQSFKIFGGKEICSNNFNETDWIESLRNFRNWSCIKFKDPVNIFQLLPENLRRQILLLVEKKILYTNAENCTYYLFEPGMHHTFKLNIPENILKVINNKDADCNIFATVIDKKEKDIFNCQVVWPPNEDPKLIIHCIQKKFRKRECKLKIRWMIIGYDINFDFNHSDLNVKLKIIKNDFNSSNRQAIIKTLDSKYDSSALYFGIPILKNNLYTTKNKYGPIFLKQKTSEIKIKYINVNCDQDDCICKCKKLEDNLKYAFLDPKDPN